MAFSEQPNTSFSLGRPAWWPQGDVQYSPNATKNEQLNRSHSRSEAMNSDKILNDYLYSGAFNSFSGADIVAYIHIPPQQARRDDLQGPNSETEAVVGVLGTLQTISYSTFREVQPVRSLGHTYSTGYTRGPRTIAGTLVWTTLDQYVLAEALQRSYISEYDPTTILIDQIPPFNIIITCNNEYGDVATMGIYGIRMVNEGSTFSVDDMITEQTNTYVATDIDMLHKGPPFRSSNTMAMMKTGSGLLTELARVRMSSHRSALQ